RLPPCARYVDRCTAAGSVPRDDVASAGREQVEQVTAGEPRRAGDEQFAHVSACSAFSAASAPERQRGTPPSAPFIGEKLPSPASVNERKNRWSAGIGENELMP